MNGASNSTRKRAQRHQNSVAFVPNKYSPVAMKIAATIVKGVCQRCLDIIEWKKRLNKYKPLKQPRTCIACSQRNVFDAYHVMCFKCAEEKNVCAKCHQMHDIVPVEDDASVLALEKLRIDAALGQCSERVRRSYVRRVGRGDSEGAAKLLKNTNVVDEIECEDESDVDSIASSEEEVEE